MHRPPPEVLIEFGVADTALSPLPGGQGTTWRAGSIVLKPAAVAAEVAWRADLLSALEDTSSFRVARPVRTRTGALIADGWEGWHAIGGREDPQRPDDVIRTGIALHAALAPIAPPPFLDGRNDVWAYGDRLAWDEIPLCGSPAALSFLKPLAAWREPVRSSSQLVHGDLLGNVLFCGDEPPAVIDWSVYFRPAAWAAAVVAVDAISWHGAEPALIDRWAHLAEWRQMLVRALMYRVAASDAASGPAGATEEILGDYQSAFESIRDRLT